MKIQSTNFLKKFKEEKSSNLVFMMVIIVFLIIVIFLFLNATNFIVKNINKRFSIENTPNMERIDESGYKLIEKKLNLNTTPLGEIKVDVKQSSNN
ncbi:MAG: hypothetical protein WCI93_00245 [bacterium]